VEDVSSRRSPGFSWLTYSFTTRDPSGRAAQIDPQGRTDEWSVRSLFGTAAGLCFAVDGEFARSRTQARLLFPGGSEYRISLLYSAEHVAGDVAAPWLGSGASEAHRRRIVIQFLDMLAELHTADWENLPAGAPCWRKFRRARGFERASLTEVACAGIPARSPGIIRCLDWAGHWLHDNCPTPPRTTIVHGELPRREFPRTERQDHRHSRLGTGAYRRPRHQDLGWALVPTFNGGSRKLYGVMERSEVDRPLPEQGGDRAFPPRSLAYYEAFAFYQMAAISNLRHPCLRGSRAFNDMRMGGRCRPRWPRFVRALDKAIEAAA